MKNIGDVLKTLIGHKVFISFITQESKRTANGILKEVSDGIVHLDIYNLCGELEKYYLNRHACTLLSVIDEGTPK